ncbi:Potassium transporter 23 [Coccomyxa sp. Obi]|nr:Potassium transporter 23 [Coccomyxa sp. Obi]
MEAHPEVVGEERRPEEDHEQRSTDFDLEANVKEEQLKNSKGWRLWILVYQSIGVVYGGLGTSPLYVYPNIFSSTPAPADVLGTMSLIFWTLTIVVIFKYVSLVLHANDKGEDGVLSEQDPPRPNRGRWLELSKPLQKALLGVVLLGTAFMFCDGILSPAASVVSAMAGVQIINPDLSNDAMAGISCAILLALFSIQRFGTSRLGMVFSPVLLLWFLVNAAIGVYNIARHMPDVFKAISPHYAFMYFLSSGRASWVSLTGIVLCISGSEATYADMGHFSHRAITIGTAGLVYPSLLLIYFGETAYLAKFPESYAQSYYKSIPEPLFWPCFIIAMASALVGSQSLITSAFSVVRQSAVLSCFPPVRVKHTGKKVEGQVYIPEVNWMLCILGIAIVAGFRDITTIGNAFGLVVVMVMVIITILFTVVMLVVWNWHPIPVFGIFAAFFTMEGVYLSAVLYKVPRGGWFPLLVASVVLCIAATWHWGSLLRLRNSRSRSHKLVEELLQEPEAPDTSSSRGTQLVLARGDLSCPMALDVSVHSGRSISRVPGIAVYLSEHAFGLPSGFVHVLKTVGVVHHTVIFLTVQKVPLPTVPQEQRFVVRQLEMPGFYRVLCRTGYTDTLVKNPAFLDSLLQVILEEARYKALAAKWSAAEIYSKSASRDADGGFLSTPALRRKSEAGRSMRNIEVPLAQQQEAAAAASGQQQAGASELRSMPSHDADCQVASQLSQASMEQHRRQSVSFSGDFGSGSGSEDERCVELQLRLDQQPLAGSQLPGSSGAVTAASSNALCTNMSGAPREAVQLSAPAGTPRIAAVGAPSPPKATEPGVHLPGGAARARRGPASQLSFRRAGEGEAAAIVASRTHGLTFVMARYVLKAAKESHWLRRLLIENLYGTLRCLSYDANESWCAVHEHVLDVRITYHV